MSEAIEGDAMDWLVATELAQVWFVRDCVQLVFEDNGPQGDLSLQCWVWPCIRTASQSVEFGEPGYRDKLCDLIGATVIGVDSTVGLTVDFGNRALLVDPQREELPGPEIAMLHRFGSRGDFMVWRPGEDSFAYLR